MRLTKLYVRFFRSFNFDYERKADPKAQAEPWEMVEDVWFPFIRLPLDREVTAVVGANESGKSHLIDALKLALTGKGIDRRDFCRYSRLYSVEAGQVRTPDFGVEFELQDETEVDAAQALGVSTGPGQLMTLLRLNGSDNLLLTSEGAEHGLDAAGLKQVESWLPIPFELETEIPIPDSIPLAALTGSDEGALTDRRRRSGILDLLKSLGTPSKEELAARGDELVTLLSAEPQHDEAREQQRRRERSLELGRNLLLDVAAIDESAFRDLESELKAGEEGRVGGIVERMNHSIARRLNFSRWWTQDKDFELRLSPREHEVALTIHDRTGSEYSFSERSRGLTYFLSYFVQLQAHRKTQKEARAEVLLMDEPDAFLSSVGQQDLLRTLENFARPDDSERKDQVLYVTHSPFLINKNAAHRIRVLEKGTNEEGTRVVKDAAQNRYEPLRSSIGAYVAETAFIGGTNLFVEGPTDQILLTGMTSLLRYRGDTSSRMLDLNEVTIVPSGSADSVPYMAYLARGRDHRKASCVALLDGDDQGRAARQKLLRNVLNGKQILEDRFVVIIADWAEQAGLDLAHGVVPQEIEDLIPLPVAVEAARGYAMRLASVSADDVEALDVDGVAARLAGNSGRVWPALKEAFSEDFQGAGIDKVGFAKELVGYLESVRDAPRRPPGLKAMETNFSKLLIDLNDRLRLASETELERMRSRRLDRLVAAFIGDHSTGATKDQADQLLRDIEIGLEEGPPSDRIRDAIGRLRRDFSLGSDHLSQVARFGEFTQRLEALDYQERLALREQATAH